MAQSRAMLQKFCFVLGILFCISPWGSPSLALVLGLVIALIIGNPFLVTSQKWAKKILPLSVMGLGAGIDLTVVVQAGLHGLVSTFVGLCAALLLGHALAKLLSSDRNPSLLITVGTAICGGSAIAALAPVLRAKDEEISVALGTVFLLNALALWVFPWIGHHFQMTEVQFGIWSALAIHDTSSVVGSTLQYGPTALAVGTTVKLARALWIVPVTLFFAWVDSRTSSREEFKFRVPLPWFILGFVMIASVVTFFPILQPGAQYLAQISRTGLVLVLFLIGTNLSFKNIQSIGPLPLVLGVALWLMISSMSLFSILNGLILTNSLDQ